MLTSLTEEVNGTLDVDGIIVLDDKECKGLVIASSSALDSTDRDESVGRKRRFP